MGWNPFRDAKAMWDNKKAREQLEAFILQRLTTLEPGQGFEVDVDYKDMGDPMAVLYTQAAENIRRKHPNVALEFFHTKLVVTKTQFVNGIGGDTLQSAKNAGLIITGHDRGDRD